VEFFCNKIPSSEVGAMDGAVALQCSRGSSNTAIQVQVYTSPGSLPPLKLSPMFRMFFVQISTRSTEKIPNMEVFDVCKTTNS
jgi:hypothetical protein